MTFNNNDNNNNNNMNPAGRGKKRPCLDAAPESRKHPNTGNVDGGNRNEEPTPSADNDLGQGPWILVQPGKTKPKDVSRPAAKSVIPSKTVQQFAVAETKRTSVSETEHVRTDNVGTDIVNGKQENDIEKKVVIDPANSDSVVENGNDGSKLTRSVDLVNNSSADDIALDNGIENVASTNGNLEVVAETEGASVGKLKVPWYNNPDNHGDADHLRAILRAIRLNGGEGTGSNPPPPVGEWKPTLNCHKDLPSDVWLTITSFLLPHEMKNLEVTLGVSEGSISNPASKLVLKSFRKIAEDYWGESVFWEWAVGSRKSLEPCNLEKIQLSKVQSWCEIHVHHNGYELIENESWHGIYTFLFRLLERLIVSEIERCLHNIYRSYMISNVTCVFRREEHLLALVIWAAFGVPSLPNTIMGKYESFNRIHDEYNGWPFSFITRQNEELGWDRYISKARMKDIASRLYVIELFYDDDLNDRD